ncbi:MAG: hypothetical protein ACYDBY_05185 [Thermoanaerobaculia bacterium]
MSFRRFRSPVVPQMITVRDSAGAPVSEATARTITLIAVLLVRTA